MLPETVPRFTMARAGRKRDHYVTSRGAVLWRATVDAIRRYVDAECDNAGYASNPHLFLTKSNRANVTGGLTHYYRETLKSAAEKLLGRTVPYTLDSIRDGAQNAADDGDADAIHTEMLMG